jgi:hypothetical protein
MLPSVTDEMFHHVHLHIYKSSILKGFDSQMDAVFKRIRLSEQCHLYVWCPGERLRIHFS